MISVNDVLVLAEHFFIGGEPAGCADSMDVDADGMLTLSDILALLAYQFLDGGPPMAPFPTCGFVDPGAFGCADYSCP